MENRNSPMGALGLGAVGLGAGLLYHWLSNGSECKTEVIDTIQKCHEAVQIIRKHCSEIPVLGFDCEWVYESDVALLQLCTHKGYCALIRLCYLEDIPTSLHNLLRDENVIKVGVDAIRDAHFLEHSSIFTCSTLDLRFVAVLTGAKPQKLSAMYEAVVGKSMNKNIHLARSDWEARQLTQEQIKYAADDAIAAIEIYMKLCEKGSDVKVFKNYYDVKYDPYYHNKLKPIASNECNMQ